jgi:hypothetical protein
VADDGVDHTLFGDLMAHELVDHFVEVTGPLARRDLVETAQEGLGLLVVGEEKLDDVGGGHCGHGSIGHESVLLSCGRACEPAVCLPTPEMKPLEKLTHPTAVGERLPPCRGHLLLRRGTQDMETTVDSAFIRRAVEVADLNAVRVALYQQTGDPELAQLPTTANLDEAQRELLISKAVAWLEHNAGPAKLAEPPEAELRTLMNMATAEEMGDLEFEARRDLPAFKEFPWTADWTDGKPELPEGFKVAIIGSGFSGLAMGVQLERLGIPYVLLERRGEPGGVWTINRYPDVRVDTISITYEFSFEKDYKWNEYFGRGADVRAYLDHISRKYGVHDHTLFNRDLKRATFDEGRNVWVLESDTPTVPRPLRPMSSSPRSGRSPTRGSYSSRARRASRGRSCTPPVGHPTSTLRASGSPSSATAPPGCSSWHPSPPRPSRCSSSSARHSGSALARSTARPLSPSSTG